MSEPGAGRKPIVPPPCPPRKYPRDGPQPRTAAEHASYPASCAPTLLSRLRAGRSCCRRTGAGPRRSAPGACTARQRLARAGRQL